ncbi:MAG: hypothetical protein AB7O84_09155 [Planctomycetota bacterium]
MASRRAFFGMGIAFVVGSAIGSACGYSVGSRAAATAAGRDGDEDPLTPTGDADLDELHRLAVVAPIEELMGAAQTYLMLMSRTYRSDRVLWRGFERIARELVDVTVEADRPLCVFAAQVVEQGETPLRDPYLHWGPKLRSRVR